MADAEIIDDADALEGPSAAWDALASYARLPLAAPAVLPAWWPNTRAARAALRVVVVRDGGEVVGVAPYFPEPARRWGRRDYRLIGSGHLVAIAPLAACGRGGEGAEAPGGAPARA